MTVVALALTGTIATGVAGSAAVAVPPDNDTYADRIAVGPVPFHTAQDTSQATTDAADAELNLLCGAPATDASVWYQVTATEDDALVADSSDSDYSAGVIVATGSPGSFDVVACAPGAAAWPAVAGQTYQVLVIDDQRDGAGNGGSMKLTVETVPPIPSIAVTVNPFGVHNQDGSATVLGSITCDSTATDASLEASLNQRVGRGSVIGVGHVDVTCDGAPHPFSVTVTPFSGKFAGGKTATVTFAIACGRFTCGADYQENIIQLRGNA